MAQSNGMVTIRSLSVGVFPSPYSLSILWNIFQGLSAFEKKKKQKKKKKTASLYI